MTTMSSVTTDRLVALAEVIAAVGLSEPTIRRRIRSGHFPQPMRVSARAVRWRESDLAAWCASLAPAKAVA
jgi:prophage regulatory protein